MEYKKYDCNSYNIHTIKTDKFKTVRMEIIFSREVEREKMPLFSFLCDILTDCSKHFQRRKDIAIRLEELYKANFYGVSNKVGNLFTASFIMEFIDPHFINENNYLKDVLSFPFKIINNPKVKNREFDITNFNIIKRRMKEEIESIKESSGKLALINALKTMDENSPSSYKVLGTVEELEKITPANLYDAYEDLLNHSNCDIFIIGNINENEIIDIIKDNFKNRVIKLNRPILQVNNESRKKVKEYIEKSNFVQSTLVMIYNINDLDKDLKNTSFHVFNYLLGSGGISSKLYKNLRCDNSLCYAVRSLYLKYDGLLIVLVSLDKSNVKLAEKLIKKSINEMLNGDYDEETLEDAKKNLTFSLKMGLDNNVSILNNYVFNVYDGLPLLEKRIELINKTTREDLLKCGHSLYLNTIYIQDAGDNND
ncbi:MAG: insulinase family protein [Firmicutes bacterium]|nr:insulinase family protein [Bacillota bacterium]